MNTILGYPLVLWAAYALVFVAVFLVARMLLREEEARAAEERLEDVDLPKSENFLFRISKPFFKQYFVPVLRGKTFWDNQRKLYKRKLISAGLKNAMTPDEFIAFKLFMPIFFPFVGGLLKALDLISISWIYIIGLVAAGWFYPDFWLKTRIDARQKAIRKAMPFIVDLLALSTEAGLDFMAAIGRVVEKAAPSPLVEEFEQLLKEIRVGSSRAESLREMALRVDMTEINSFVAILISSEQMGASIGKVLRQQSDQIRSERFVRAERAGAIAAQKLLLPLVLFILPAVLLMVFGPFLLSVVGSGSGL